MVDNILSFATLVLMIHQVNRKRNKDEFPVAVGNG
jgi:hypothetical protein